MHANISQVHNQVCNQLHIVKLPNAALTLMKSPEPLGNTKTKPVVGNQLHAMLSSLFT